jgi:hypothetical protein
MEAKPHTLAAIQRMGIAMVKAFPIKKSKNIW